MLVILSKDAQRQYERIPKAERTKVYKKLFLLQEKPQAGKKLSGEFKGVRSLRAWPYRIIYEVHEREKRVTILKIAHRQSVYK